MLLLPACGGGPWPDVAPTSTHAAAAPCWDLPGQTVGDPGDAAGLDLGVESVGRYFGNPLRMLPDPSGEMVVVEKDGQIRTVPDPRRVVLDIADRLVSHNEQGLLDAAFAPDGSRLFVHYSAKDSGDTVIAEYPLVDGVAQADEETELLRLSQAGPGHNGGALVMGPDGYLYLALGDGGGGNRPDGPGQDHNNPYGAILRLDVCTPGELAAAADNPEQLGDERVLHYGLRNPYRIAFDDGLLYIADAGQADKEEIDVVPTDKSALNFGWPAYEGTKCNQGPCDRGPLVPPVTEYGHDEDGGCAVVGGEVYRGSAIPELVGYYLYGDFCTQRIWALKMDGTEVADEQVFDLEWEGALLGFGHDADGEMYFGTNAGQLYRFVKGS